MFLTAFAYFSLVWTCHPQAAVVSYIKIKLFKMVLSVLLSKQNAILQQHLSYTVKHLVS